MPKKLKILLAEDDPFLCRYIKTLISQWECDLAVEQTAEGAIQRAATFKPNVALLGFITPGMNGAEAGIRLLRNSPETGVVLTVESVPSEVLDDLRARGYDFRTLAAPFNIEELQELCFSSYQEEEQGSVRESVPMGAGREMQIEGDGSGISVRRLEKRMFENQKCCVGLKKDGGWVIPHDPDGWTDSLQCDEPVVALEAYADFADAVLPVCERHRPLIQLIYADFRESEARRQRFTANGSTNSKRRT